MISGFVGESETDPTQAELVSCNTVDDDVVIGRGVVVGTNSEIGISYPSFSSFLPKIFERYFNKAVKGSRFFSRREYFQLAFRERPCSADFSVQVVGVGPFAKSGGFSSDQAV